MKKITENVYGMLTLGGNMNLYVIANGDSLTVVDTILGARDINRLEKELGTQGWTWDNVKHILITHAHPDHIGGLPELQKRTNATTYAHRIDAAVIRGEQDTNFAPAEELSPIFRMIRNRLAVERVLPIARVDVDLSDGDVLDAILPGLTVVHLPGHSYGQVGYYIPKDKLLIGGDVMMRMFGSLRMPIRLVSPDWKGVKASIRRVADMDVEILCLGHGVLLNNANPAIDAFAKQKA